MKKIVTILLFALVALPAMFAGKLGVISEAKLPEDKSVSEIWEFGNRSGLVGHTKADAGSFVVWSQFIYHPDLSYTCYVGIKLLGWEDKIDVIHGKRINRDKIESELIKIYTNYKEDFGGRIVGRKLKTNKVKDGYTFPSHAYIKSYPAES